MAINEVPPVVPVVIEPVVPAEPLTTEPPALANPELAAAREKIAALEAEVAASRLQTAARQASGQVAKLNTGTQDVAIQRAISVTGGIAKWFTLTTAQQLQALGQVPPSAQEMTEVAQYFGRGSDSQRANALSKQDSSKYMRLRLLARLMRVI